MRVPSSVVCVGAVTAPQSARLASQSRFPATRLALLLDREVRLEALAPGYAISKRISCRWMLTWLLEASQIGERPYVRTPCTRERCENEEATIERNKESWR